MWRRYFPSRVLAVGWLSRGYVRLIETLALSLANNRQLRIPVSQEWKE